MTDRARQVIAASEAASGRIKTGSGVRARPSSAPFLKGASRLSPADQQHIASLEAQIAHLQSSVEVSVEDQQGVLPCFMRLMKFVYALVATDNQARKAWQPNTPQRLQPHVE